MIFRGNRDLSQNCACQMDYAQSPDNDKITKLKMIEIYVTLAPRGYCGEE